MAAPQSLLSYLYTTLGTTTTTANTAAGQAAEAQTTANTAAGQAAEAKTTANTAAGQAAAALSTANTAAGQAAEAQTTANTAAGQAAAALSTANTATGQAAAALTAANAAAGAYTMTGTIIFDLSGALPADYSAALATNNIVVFTSNASTQAITIPAGADGTGYAGPYRVYNDNDPTVEGALSIALVSNDATPVSLANTVAPGTNVTLVWNATLLKWFSLLG